MTREEHLLTILMEECAEVSQQASKMLRFGVGNVDPNTNIPNTEMLLNELTDLYAVLEMLLVEGTIPRTQNHDKIQIKKDKVEYFLDYSNNVGKLTEA